MPMVLAHRRLPLVLLLATLPVVAAFAFGALSPNRASAEAPGDYTEIISAGNRHACVVTASGEIDCWGENGSGQSSPPAGRYSQVSAGDSFSCAVSTANEVMCWGFNTYGQASPPSDAFLQVSANLSWYNACGVTIDGDVVCWGRGGRSDTGPFVQVDPVDNSWCALTPNGELSCNYGGFRRGGGPPTGYFSQVSHGKNYGCALARNGMVTCWGNDQDTGKTQPPSSRFVQLSSGWDHSCAVKSSGEVQCWGDDEHGQATPPTSMTFVQVSAGSDHTCGVTTQGSVQCWGFEAETQLKVPDYLSLPGAVAVPTAGEGGSGMSGPLRSGQAAQIYVVGAVSRLDGPTGGRVTSSAQEVQGDDAITLTATPDGGYRFVRWEGDASGNQNPITITPSSHIFVTAVFEREASGVPGPRSPIAGTPIRTSLFASRTLMSQVWQIGQPVDLALPRAIGGSGVHSYSIKYEHSGDQTWTPAGVTFDRNTLRFSGTPSMALSPNQALRKFTVFLRVDDRIRLGEWDELEFVVNLIPAPVVSTPITDPKPPPAAGPAPQQCTPDAAALSYFGIPDDFGFTNVSRGIGRLDANDCESPRFSNHYADRYKLYLGKSTNVLITLMAESSGGAVGSLVLLDQQGESVLALGDHIDGPVARIEQHLSPGRYIIETNAIEPHPAYRIYVHQIPDNCRTVGPVAQRHCVPGDQCQAHSRVTNRPPRSRCRDS